MSKAERDSVAFMFRLDERDKALLEMCLTCFKNNNVGSEILEFDSDKEEWFGWGRDKSNS